MLSDLEFFVSEALVGMKRSGLMTFISIATITVSLIIFGFFLLLSSNFNNLANLISSKLEIRVYLKDTLTKREIINFENELRKIKEVKKIVFVDKEQAWQNFQQNFKNINLNDLIESTPLPNSFSILLEHNENIVDIAQHIRGYTDYVEDVNYGGAIAKNISVFANFVKLGGLGVVLLLSLATLLIIVNTIRLTLIARQDEITIMRLVGATKAFIKIPFIIEGLFIGIIGAILSILFLKTTYGFIAMQIQDNISFFPLVFEESKLNYLYFMVGISGTFLGFLGAYISVSKSLKK